MTYEQYKAKREVLMNQLQKLIDTGAAEKEYQAKKTEVENLDKEWERDADRQAEMNMYSGNRKNITPGWITPGSVESVGMNGYGGSYTGYDTSSEPLFLGSGRKMVDIARERHPEQIDLFTNDNSLGDTIRGIVTGKWNRPELKNAISTSGTSVIIPSVLSAGVIDLARELSLFGAANVPTVSMETNNLKISRVASDPTFKFKAEGAAATENSFSLDSVTLNAKTIYGYAYVTLEAIESSQNLDAIIRQVFAEAMARGIDKTMLYGQYNEDTADYDSFAPSGIMRDAGILQLAVDHYGVSYNDFIMAIAKIRKQNGNPSAVAINARTEEMLSLLTDLNGVYLQPPKAYSDLQQIVTNQLTEDDINGSDALVFDPAAMLIGIQNRMRIKVMDQGDEQLKKGLVGFQIYSMLDCKVVRPKAICKITGIRPEAGPEGATGATGESS